MRLKGLLLLTLGLIIMNANAQTMTLDEAKIRRNIHGFSVLADQGAFQYLGRLLTPELKLDYTALFGGDVQTVKREALMKQWAEFLPGFDITFHDLSEVKVTIEGNTAKATVKFTASHWLGEEGFWAVSGSYEFALKCLEGNWYIRSIKLNRESEQGSRDILSIAPKRAVANFNAQEALKVNF